MHSDDNRNGACKAENYGRTRIEGGRMKNTEKEIDDQFDEMDDYDPLDDYCDECRVYGDDYSFDEDGKMVDNCVECPFNSANNDWED